MSILFVLRPCLFPLNVASKAINLVFFMYIRMEFWVQNAITFEILKRLSNLIVKLDSSITFFKLIKDIDGAHS